jgi:hypothetical protein
MGTILFMLVVSLVFGSSMFTFYYLFSKIFPDARNTDGPPQFSSLNKDQLAEVWKTKASKLSAIFTMLFICFGGYLWFVLPEKYLLNQVTNDGITTVGIVISSRHHKNDIGEHKTYRFADLSGNEYTDYIKADNLNVGDSVNVFYSKSNPVNHKVWKKW